MKTLKDLRESRGLTLKQVAQATGMSMRTVHRHERGASSVSLEQARVYANFYDVPVDEIAEV